MFASLHDLYRALRSCHEVLDELIPEALQGFPPIATISLGNTTNSVAIEGTIAPKW
jgi:hypothetical protein